jgi:hypothetical protein
MFVRETKTPASLLRRDDAPLSTHAQVFLLDTQTARKKVGRKKVKITPEVQIGNFFAAKWMYWQPHRGSLASL